MARPKRISEEDVGRFMRAYGRKRPKGAAEPNDRDYSEWIAEAIRRLSPEELDKFLRGEQDDADPGLHT
jgi:hypothetical protein